VGAAGTPTAAGAAGAGGGDVSDDEFGDDWDVDEIITELPRWWGYSNSSSNSNSNSNIGFPA
jgi:hypothetical protein